MGGPAETFEIELEIREDLLLGPEAIQHFSLQLLLLLGEGEPDVRVTEKQPGPHAAARSHVIRSEFPDLRALSRQPRTHRECARIMIGMAAFVRMRQRHCRLESIG